MPDSISEWPKRSARTIWITWENQRRNRELAAALGVRLNEWADIDAIRNLARKYVTGVSRTLRFVLADRPALIICQNPSIVLAVLSVVSRPFTGAGVVVDAHNGGLQPAEGRSAFLNFVSRWVQRRADLTIVSNDALAAQVRHNGGRAFTLPDRIPEIHGAVDARIASSKTILFVCTYAADEPYAEVLEAARRLPPDITVYVSGNYRKRGLDPAMLPPHVRLTGYLSEQDYVSLMASVGVVMDLTSREDCLVCGAYEALALGKPMILSDTKANRDYFSSGVVYTRHDQGALHAAMLDAIERRDELAREVAALKTRRSEEWEVSMTQLRERLVEIVARA